ncbi:Alpha/Beta hydrolase protein [Aspergillus unguis]
MNLPTVTSIFLGFTSIVLALPLSPPTHIPKDLKLSYHPAPSHSSLGISVLVIPGGGYQLVSLDMEGTNSTLYLNSRGYDAWVLNYTTASTLNAPVPLYPVPQDEAIAAVKYIKQQEAVRVDKLGIWGYSAGGHLAAVTVTDERVQGDLDFGILSYPVISMDADITHNGSRVNLIGNNPSDELVEEMSAENRVTEDTPPIFIYHSANDATVPVENALRFIGAMTGVSRPYEALILPDAPHGIALGLGDPVRDWTGELDRWMKYSI